MRIFHKIIFRKGTAKRTSTAKPIQTKHFSKIINAFINHYYQTIILHPTIEGDAILNNGFSVRQIESRDMNSLKQITYTSFPSFFRSIAAQSQYSEGQVLISEEQGTAVGFAKLVKFHVEGGKFGCILGIAVLPQFRRKGIATELVKAGTECMKNDGAMAVFATAERINFASLAVFDKAGFRRMGFLSLWRIFGWRIFEFYRDIRLGPGHVVLMYD
jgi:RimJ/RimL family protein N-acetyltransferase